MRHQNTVFHDLIKHVPWTAFDRLVGQHGSDRRVRRLDSRSQFLALLYGQLSGVGSLRSIEAGMASHRNRLYHLGAKVPARSTLADANARRPAALYMDLFAHMARAADRSTRRHMRDAVRILDATRIKLSGPMADWKAGALEVPAIKLHVVYDPDAQAPIGTQMTSSLVNDITHAKTLEITAGATYVFDMGYYSFEWWAELHNAGARFVTRLRANTKLCNTVERTPPEGIIAERTGHLPKPFGKAMSAPVREIVVRISTGKTIRVVTNDLDAPAAEIAALYKERWQIELFFRWIKQNLRIKRFLGTSENAVLTQIFVALIAYLLLRLAYHAQNAVRTAITFVRHVTLNLMHRRPINDLTNAPPSVRSDRKQLEMDVGHA